MGASNRLQDLDPALLRPGRFDRQVLVPAAGPRRPRGDPRRPHDGQAARRRRRSGQRSHARRPASPAPTSRTSPTRRRSPPAAAMRSEITDEDFDSAMERVVAGLQQRRVVSEKEKRILAYHEAGHALMSHLMGDALPVHKVTIVSRGQALGYTLNLPAEDRYLHTKEELTDMLKVYLAGRAAEQVVFGRVTNGAANDLERATDLARAMVFDYGMSEIVSSRTMRADNYALSEETKRLRDARAGAAHRRGVRRGHAAADEVPRRRSTASPRRFSIARRSSATSSTSCSRASRGVAELGDGRHRARPPCFGLATRLASGRGGPGHPSHRRRRRRPRRGPVTYERLLGAR